MASGWYYVVVKSHRSHFSLLQTNSLQVLQGTFFDLVSQY